MAMATPYIARLLELSNDIEKNPGPPKVVKNGLISNKMTNNNTTNGSSTTVSSTKKEEIPPGSNGLNEVHNFEDLKMLVEKQNETIKSQRSEIESLRKSFEKNMNLTQDFQSELSEIRKNWQSLSENANKNGNNPVQQSNNTNNNNNNNNNNTIKDRSLEDISLRLEALSSAYTDIQDRLYELDKSWKNNLMIYGVPCCDGEEDDPIITEEKVKDVLLKKLHISRDIQMNRVHRLNYGPDFRGHKPIQVCLVNYRDKEEILRKARLLKGSNIYISEDFSRKVREHRNELIKFMKEVKTRDPTRRMTLRYDKLYVGNDVFFFNDRTGRVERLHTPLDETKMNQNFNNLMGVPEPNQCHDSSWLRRPRSRIGPSNGSRCTTPLSRQNSMSMEDFSTSMSSNPRVTSSARYRRSNPTSPRKSMSIDSLHQHSVAGNGGGGGGLGGYYDDIPPSHTTLSRQNSATGNHFHSAAANNMTSRMAASSATASDYSNNYPGDHGQIPTTSVQNGGYYYPSDPIRSNPGSPSKRVAFKGLPNSYNHQIAPYQHFEMANPRLDTPMMMNPPDEMLAIETHEPPRTSSYPALSNGINYATTSAMTPYSNGPKNGIVVPATPKNSLVNSHSNFPPLDYAQHSAMIPVSAQYTSRMQQPDKLGGGMYVNPGIGMENPVKKSNALPSICPPNHGAVQPYMNGLDDGEFEENERKLQQLEYQQQNGLHQNNKNNLVHENNKKNNDPEKTSANNGGGIPTTKTESSTINNGTIKVAIATEISMANMMASMNQCK